MPSKICKHGIHEYYCTKCGGVGVSEIFKCQYDECEYESKYKSNLGRHIKNSHLKVKNFQCSYEDCEYKTGNSSHLTRHIDAVHKQIKNCECETCGKKFDTNSHLKDHMKMVHDKIKDFECEECDYKCSTKGSLKHHIKYKHLNERNNICQKCDKKFVLNSDLLHHIKTVHDNIRDLKCSDCEYTTGDVSNYSRHIKYNCTKGRNENCSSGERVVMEFLEENSIDYIFDKNYDRLRSYEDKGYLRFDFIILTPKGPRFIEYNGRQHYGAVKRGGGMTKEEADEIYERLCKNDKIKEEYCEIHGYDLYVIEQKDRNNLDEILKDIVEMYEPI
jgi:hypothetical protein